MKALVTGATGFVGSWLTQKLLSLGYDVSVLCRSPQPKFSFSADKIKIHVGDVSSPLTLSTALKDIDVCFHLAGLVGYSKAMREEMYKTNVLGTKNVLNACQTASVKKLIYMSSVVAVGASFDGLEPLNENSRFNLHHLDLGYFETKHEAENLVIQATRAGKIDAIILNPSTIYGPGDATKGSRSTQIKVAKGKFPFYTPGGVNVIHIDDVVEALCAAVTKGRSGERYILCGENLKIHELFQFIADSAGVSAPKIYLPKPLLLALGKLGDALESFGQKGPINSENAWASVLYHWFDNSKAKRELGLQPRSAKLAISDSVQWMKDNSII